MTKAWIGLTNPEWHRHFVSHPEPIVDFWKPSGGSFRAIDPGERFFCLIRGRPHDQRVFGAMGHLREYRLLTVVEAWEQYSSMLGASSAAELAGRFELPLDQTVGNIFLDGFRIAESKVTSSLFTAETGIAVAPSIQVGKVITEPAADWLEYAMFGGEDAAAGAIGPIVDRVIGNAEPGRREVVRELVYRDRAVVEQAKREQGTQCRVCGFSFADAYGEIGEGFVEVHHWPMLSAGGSDTNRDVFVVCANCHRMLHRSREGMDWRELEALVAARQRQS